MGVDAGGPPAFVGGAGNATGIHELGVAIGKTVIGAKRMAGGSLVTLGDAVESGGAVVADLAPDPPAILWVTLGDVAMSVAEEDQFGRRLDHGPAAEIVFVTLGPAEGRLGTALGPVDIDGTEAAGDVDFAGDELTEDLRRGESGTGAFGAGVLLDFLGGAIVDAGGATHIGEEVGTPTGFDRGTVDGVAGLDGGIPLLIVATVEVRGDGELFGIGGTIGSEGPELRLGKGGKEHGCQDRDDGDHDEQLDQCEARGGSPMSGWTLG